MLRAEMIGIDPVWQRIVLPSTAVLRLGMLAAIAGAGLFHVEVAPAVQLVAMVVAVAYAGAYLAVWAARLPEAVLGLTAIGDGLLAGALVGGAGVQAPLAGFLVLLSLALAHICGGWRLFLAAAVGAAAGWGIARLAGIEGLLSAAAWSTNDFHLALEAELTYRGRSVVALSERQIVRASLAAFLLISISGCVAFLRALRERQRVAAACARVDALEAIVDRCAENASDLDFWRTVSGGASKVTGTRVLVAYSDDGMLRLEEVVGRGDGLAALRVPLDARSNLIVHSVETGREAETENIDDLLAGAVAPPQLQQPRKRTRYVIVPIEETDGVAALIAVTAGDTGPVVDGLRVVAERAALVRRAWNRLGHDFEFEAAPAGA